MENIISTEDEKKVKALILENIRYGPSFTKLSKEQQENCILVVHARAKVKEKLEDGTLVLRDIVFTHCTLEEKK